MFSDHYVIVKYRHYGTISCFVVTVFCVLAAGKTVYCVTSRDEC